MHCNLDNGWNTREWWQCFSSQNMLDTLMIDLKMLVFYKYCDILDYAWLSIDKKECQGTPSLQDYFIALLKIESRTKVVLSLFPKWEKSFIWWK